MFKVGLLASTAMTAAALLLSGADAAHVQTAMHVADRDANARFLCTYGQLVVSGYFSSASYYSYSGWTRVAVPVTGHGQTVSRIIVTEARNARDSSNWSFSAAIHSANPSGYPGKLIAGGTGRAGSTCGPVSISITPTMLKPRTKYWILEKTPRRHVSSSYISLYWEANPRAKNKAYVQTHSFTCPSSYCSNHHQGSHHTSKWRKQTMGPWFKLR